MHSAVLLRVGAVSSTEDTATRENMKLHAFIRGLTTLMSNVRRILGFLQESRVRVHRASGRGWAAQKGLGWCHLMVGAGWRAVLRSGGRSVPGRRETTNAGRLSETPQACSRSIISTWLTLVSKSFYVRWIWEQWHKNTWLCYLL